MTSARLVLIALALSTLAITPGAQYSTGSACLDGSQVVPFSTDPGQGFASLEFDEGLLLWELDFSGLNGFANAIHIHAGDCGEQGPLLFDLEPIWPNIGSVLLTGPQEALALAGDLYFDVHTSASPQGAIRGQLDFDGTASCVPCDQPPCIEPDGLVTGCCAGPTGISLPELNFSRRDGSSIIYQDCQDTSATNAVFSVFPVEQTACGQFETYFSIGEEEGTPAAEGYGSLQFARTWNESDSPGSEPHQVWRFLAKLNLDVVFTGHVPLPPCIAEFGEAFFYGYVDFARNCDTGGLWASMMLFHNCDLYIHGPLAKHPGTSHPNTAYAFVLPRDFDPSASPTPLSGPLSNDSVRAQHGAGCGSKEAISGGLLAPLAVACPCGGPSVRHSFDLVTGDGACGTRFDSFLALGTPWLHMPSFFLGKWTDTSTYPGGESLWAREGVMLYTEGCSGQTFGEFFYGASTDGGWDVITEGTGSPTLSKNFLDLADNYSLPAGSTVSLPLVGEVLPTQHVVSGNVD